MNELVYLKNDQAVCDSLQVAEAFEKRHADVIRKIENAINSERNFASAKRAFHESEYIDRQGKKRKKYIMNRDGFSFIVMGFTGEKADAWKWRYIDAFNEMEAIIRERTTEQWIEERKRGKLSRHSETDAIKELVEYATAQGSKHANMMYVSYSQLANKAAGINSRETATALQLNRLNMFENVITGVIRDGIEQGLYYKTIFQNCKKRIETLKEIAYLT